VRISLLCNWDAGDGVSVERIRELVGRNGHQIVQFVEQRDPVEALLVPGTDLVVAAGGDGTVAAVARALAGRDVPLAILPLGTANNIAKSVESFGSPEELIASWEDAVRRPFDVGRVASTWGSRTFVEGVGGGLVPRSIAAKKSKPDHEDVSARSALHDALREYRKTLESLTAEPWTIAIDGTRTSGHFLLVEVLNIASLGPNIVLSSEASPSDGLLTVVMAGDEHSDQLAEYLQALIEGRDGRLSLETRHGRRVEILGPTEVHVDDEVACCSPTGAVSIDVQPAAIEILLPRRTAMAP
jgi:diacylglycerol kinase family enzyme